MAQPEKNDEVLVKSNLSKDIIRKYHRVPISLYRIKDIYVDVTTNPNFVDALLVIAALVAFASAFPFYPILVLVALILVLFVFTLRHAFLGLVLLMVMIFPMLMFQTPALAYIFLIVMTMGLVFGARHYRTFIFAAILIPLALSPLGYLFSVPALIIGVLIVGYRRAGFLAAVFVIAIVMLSAVTGVQNSGYISYNAQLAHTAVSGSPALNYSIPNKPQPSIFTFSGALATVSANINNQAVVGYMYTEFSALFEALAVQPFQYILDLVGLIVIVILIDTTAVASRSVYKGTEASLIGIVYPLLYFAVSFTFKTVFTYIVPLGSFLIAPALLYILELYRIDVVKALDVRKEDLRIKFGRHSRTFRPVPLQKSSRI